MPPASRSLPFCRAFRISVTLLVNLGVAVVELQTSARSALSTETVDGHEAAARRAIVRYRKDARRVADLRAELDADVVPLSGGLHLIRSRSRRAVDLVATLSGRPGVLYAEPDYLVRADAGAPNDPLFPQQWFLSNPQTMHADVHATGAWQMTVGSTAHVVGVVDTGIDHNHADLSANLWTAPTAYTVYLNGRQTRLDCPAGSHGIDVWASNCSAVDEHGHGTGMAGVIGAVGNNGIGVSGVNWRASIMDLRFMGPSGTGLTSDLINVLDAAIQLKQIFGAEADIRVLSNSFTSSAYSQALFDEISKTNAAGMLYVAAAGNGAANNDVIPSYPAGYDIPNVVAVAATTQNDAIAGYSNYGATTVHVGAPGDQITTTYRNSGYWTISGTSPAAAAVSGVAGLLVSACDLSTQSLKDLLMQTVDPVAALGGRTVTGGRVNAERAIQPCSGGNSAPHVTVTSPPNGSRFDEPAAITVTADAFDTDGHIARVDFYANSALIGSATGAPYSIEWNGVAAGTYSVSAIATDDRGASGSSPAMSLFVDRRALPSPWASRDIGPSSVSGTASYSNGVFTLRGSGADVWGTSDAFRYAYQPLTGDGTVVARVASLEYVHAWTKAGVMIRETLDASSAHAFMLVSAAKGISFQRRTSTGGTSASTTIAGAAPHWLKLTRAGRTITASTSSDGSSWTVVGSTTFPMAQTVFVGLAVTSHDATRAATATFSSVAITPP
jgi:regulation of enolase protein 1 (concanavalin A-like superfamily)